MSTHATADHATDHAREHVAARFATDAAAGIDARRLDGMRAEFQRHPTATLAQNAVTKSGLMNVALNRRVVNATDHSFSHKLDDWGVTNQKQTGRCWMFAGLNLFRPAAMKAMNLKDFEFSQNFTLFWDKLERANYFLEAIIASADRPVDDRTVAFLLDRPLDDGGQWNMFVSLIKKHGVCPKYAMPETESSSNTRRMNADLLTLLRRTARDLREAVAGRGEDAARALKLERLDAVHRVLAIHLGTPPESFLWQWNDDDDEFHRDGSMTPRDFADKYLPSDLDEYVCLVHDPRPSSPVHRTFTVDCLGNVVGGDVVTYLNVGIDEIRRIAMRTIMDGEPVWFGCDVGKMMDRKAGIWDEHLFELSRVYDADLSMAKADRLLHHETLMTHAMLFTGVDVVGAGDDAKPTRWRVENSWGEDNGRKGFYVMNDNWFEHHMFEIAAHKRYLSDEQLAAFDREPIVLPPWDPMGALARGESLAE